MPKSRSPIHPHLAISNSDNLLEYQGPRSSPRKEKKACLRIFAGTNFERAKLATTHGKPRPHSPKLMANRRHDDSFAYPEIKSALREHGFDPAMTYACMSTSSLDPKSMCCRSLPSNVHFSKKTPQDRINTVERNSSFFLRYADLIAKQYAPGPTYRVLLRYRFAHVGQDAP
ncbi:BQ2448_5844 [Microbotryum intermedium]|uniref:BQ2448_5844 protein n=1 Tax=Microbotryum intermedium TaxID=269621 RepID=A0A238F7P7_9BASI|nr:BQ2448_5844 [Microbotryum intermedium]